MIDEILQGKPRLIIMNKADLADPEVTRQWQAHFKENGLTAFPVDASTGTGVKDIPNQIKPPLKEKIDKQIAKGMNPRAMRVLIVGIPNVGKSTLINRLAGRNIAETGDRPGVTKGGNGLRLPAERWNCWIHPVSCGRSSRIRMLGTAWRSPAPLKRKY